MVHRHNFLALFSRIFLMVTLLCLLGVIPPLWAASIVGDGSPASCTGTALAVAVNSGGTVTFNCGANPHTILVEAMIISSGQQVTMDGAGLITLSGSDSLRLFKVESGGALTLERLTLSNGYSAESGGAIWNQGTLTIEQSSIRDSRADVEGGAILNDNGFLQLKDSAIFNNQAVKTGGVANAQGTAILDHVTIEGNLAQAYSGVNNSGTLSLLNSIVRNNSASDVSGYGGGVGNSKGSLTILASTIISNTAQQYFGGGIAVMDGDVTIEESDILSNTSGIGGGGLYVHANANAQVTVRNSRIAYNATLAQDANVFGGGVYNARKLTLDRVIVSHNQSGLGGSVFSVTSDGALTIRQSTFVANSARGFGGALWLSGSSAPNLTNVTISDNRAEMGGGALYLSDSTAALQNVTIYNNRAPSGANLYLQSATPLLRNTIVAAPVDSTNCAFAANTPAINSGGYNLASDDSCNLGATGDQQNLDPQLAPLAANGSLVNGEPLLSHLPLAGSAAIDAGDGPSCPATDARDYLRNVGNGCDIGAIEADAAPFEPTVTPTPSVTPTFIPIPTTLPTAILAGPHAVTLVHPQVANGVVVTLALSPTHGFAEQQINVSGQAPSGTSEVRISTTRNGQTVGEAVVPVTHGSYDFDFAIPPDAETGSIELCAIPVGELTAQFVCTSLQIDAPPLINVTGKLPEGVVTVGTATLHLQSLYGSDQFVTTIGSDGSFALAGVPAGTYAASLAGQISKPIAGEIVAFPYRDQDATVKITAPLGRCAELDLRHQIGYLTASNTRAGADNPFGIYVRDVKNDVTFEAFPQAEGPIQAVRFEVLGPNRERVVPPRDVTQPPYRITLNVGDLPASVGNRHATLYATPLVAGSEGCTLIHEIQVIQTAFSRAPFQANGITWDKAANLYRIAAILPKIDNILPVEFQVPPPPLPELPYLGRYDNRLNSGFQLVGTLNLDGYVHLNLLRAILEAKLMDHVVLGKDTGWTLLNLNPNQAIFYKNVDEFDLPFNSCDLFPKLFGKCMNNLFGLDLPLIKIPVVSFFGFVDVIVSGSAGFGGSVGIEGHLRPLKPELVATLSATGEANAEIGLGVRILIGLVEAGASTRVDAEVSTPLTLQADLQGVGAKLEACLRMKLSVTAYAEALYGFKSWRDTTVLITFPDNGDPNCVTLLEGAGLQADAEPDLPNLIAAPAIAIAPDGTQLSAYVAETTVISDTPQVQVLARFKAPAAQEWETPVSLSVPEHSASSPVVAFVGPNQTPLVAWVENMLTLDEAKALGEDLSTQIRHQEIVYRTWDGATWRGPIYLTDDQLGDGLPALAGSADGALLAWTRDLDGDTKSRDDQRIAVTRFDPASNQFGEITLLSPPQGGLNGDVQVTYDQSVDPAQPYVVWINDQDTSLVTASDRTLALATYQNNDWTLLDTQTLPPAVDSPTISAGSDGLHLAFLVRQADPDGKVGLIGTNGMLWSALFQNAEWSNSAVVNENNSPVYAEQPRLATQGSETLLLFRRFANDSQSGRLGQIALSQLGAQAKFAVPLDLTNDPFQNWQPALAINPLNGVAAILKVARSAANLVVAESTQRRNATPLSSNGDPIEAIAVTATGDPALDPLSASTLSPAAGQLVTVTVHLHNLGRGVVNGVTVSLYRGVPGSGTLLGTLVATGTMGFNQSRMLPFAISASGGQESIYAELKSSGGNGSSTNDRATLMLGQLNAPRIANVATNQEIPNALLVSWVSSPSLFASGYRILRGATPTGPFEVVGESNGNLFNDTLVKRGESYCYAVQTYNTNHFSERSAAVCGALPLLKLYLPVIRR